MWVNDSDTRVARIYATELAIGDVIIDSRSEYLGRVDSVPEIEGMTVTFQMDDGDGGRQGIAWPVTKLVRIEIARRTS